MMKERAEIFSNYICDSNLNYSDKDQLEFECISLSKEATRFCGCSVLFRNLLDIEVRHLFISHTLQINLREWS